MWGKSFARLAGGIATALAGALSFASAVTPDVPWRLHLVLEAEPGSLMRLEHVLTAVGARALGFLGGGFVRRRRPAVNLAIGVLLALSLLHAAKGLDYEEAAVAL